MLIKKDMKNILLLMFSTAFGILANGQCQMSATINNVTCCGASNGTIGISAFGGTAPYNIAWTGPVSGNPAGNEINSNIGNYIISNLPSGTYTIYLTDANGCTAMTVATITQPPCLIGSSTSTNCLCFGDQTGSITITSTGGVAPYNVSWSGPVFGNPAGIEINASGGSYTINSLPAGTYAVDVTDASGCQWAMNVTITQPNALVASTGNFIPNVCNGISNGSATITASNGTAPYNVSWSGPVSGNPVGSEIAVSGGTYTITSLSAGTYTVTVMDANNCSTTTIFTITEPVQISVNTTTANVSCFGGSTGSSNITVGGGVAPYHVSWTGPVNGDPAGTEIAVSGGSYNITNLPAGSYTVTVTDANNCSTNTNFLILQPSPLNVTGITSINGIDITVGGGTPPYTYAWSTGTSTEDLTNLMPGTYTVTVTDFNGCTQTDSFTVQNADILTVSPSVLEIYPNPACDKLTLKMKHSNNVPFYIADNLGRTVIKGSSEFELTEIPINSLKAGIYLLHMDNVTLTFIKE